jgi:hypothetical protein
MGLKMKILLILIFLAGCSNIQDNTTVEDKFIIGGTLAVIISGGSAIGAWQ